MKTFLPILLLFFAACTGRIKSLERLVGTDITDLQPRWDKPILIMPLQNNQQAYTYMQFNAQTKPFETAAGAGVTQRASDIFYIYTVLTTDTAGLIQAWKVEQVNRQLDSTEIVQKFNLNPR